jgi:hypothetical protein
VFSDPAQQLTTQWEEGGWGNHIICRTWAQSFLSCLVTTPTPLGCGSQALHHLWAWSSVSAVTLKWWGSCLPREVRVTHHLICHSLSSPLLKLFSGPMSDHPPSPWSLLWLSSIQTLWQWVSPCSWSHDCSLFSDHWSSLVWNDWPTLEMLSGSEIWEVIKCLSSPMLACHAGVVSVTPNAHIGVKACGNCGFIPWLSLQVCHWAAWLTCDVFHFLSTLGSWSWSLRLLLFLVTFLFLHASHPSCPSFTIINAPLFLFSLSSLPFVIWLFSFPQTEGIFKVLSCPSLLYTLFCL